MTGRATCTPANAARSAWWMLAPSVALMLAGDVVPLVGVLYWGWDAFVLLMLYWTETVVIAFWTLARIGLTPPETSARPSIFQTLRRNRGTVLFFALHSGIFMFVHLVFLLVLFSGDWFAKTGGPIAFLCAIFIGSGIWIPLAFTIASGAVSLATALRAAPSAPRDDWSMVGGLYKRIVIMQLTIIAGAFFVEAIGSIVPLVIMTVLKLLVDLRFPLFAHIMQRD
jgi:hypothetical protein